MFNHNRKKVAIAGFLFLLVFSNGLFAAEGELAATRRFGIFIGSNNGGRDRVMLRYAVSDAKSVSKVFSGMGGITNEDNVLLVEPTMAEINRQLDNMGRLSAQSRRNTQRTELVFYYSGHSDENGILLNRERYGYRELRERINTIPADMRIVILDSCSSGAITRAKGGVKTQPFLFDSSVSTAGYAFLTSSSADESSQESDSIESSYFTHSLLAGLRGAADSVGDGRVTLNELYRFAYTETLAQTETSVYGAQHPSYDIQISGSGDVVLTDIKEISASLFFSEDITGRISIRDSSDFLVAELTKVSRKPLELGLEPGLYRITLQRGDNFYRVEITLPENKRTTLVMGNFQMIAAASGSRSRGDNPELADDGDVPVYPFNIQILPGLNILGHNNEKVTNNVLFGFLVGFGHNIKGLGVAWLGLINTGYVEGIQTSGIFNHTVGNIRGLQASGIYNYAGGDFQGLQTSGIFNHTVGNIRGLQASGIYNYAGEISGVQTGLVNINKGGKGAMFGLVNISKSEDIIPFGLVNIMKNGIFHPFIFVDDMLFTNIGLRSGSKHFYTLLSVGIGGDVLFNRTENRYFVTRAGFGYEYTINKFFIDIDISAGTIYSTNGMNWDQYSHESFGSFITETSQLRLTAGYTIFEHLGVFAGISYDYFYKHQNSPDPRNFGGLMIGDVLGHYAHKFGFFGGIQF
ncbi:MAG: caspase family protein [Treponema sp.]|jgi:hypothetical protein|nr:caspase family protein [Treponema sp.]